MWTDAAVITADEFAALSAYDRGYVVYMFGKREDQPHVPEEDNPYPAGSGERGEWMRGWARAIIVSQDLEVG